MTPEQTKAKIIAPLVQALADGKNLEWKDTSGNWTVNNNWIWDAHGEYYQDRVRIAKERHVLPDVIGGNGDNYQCWIDTDGLHVGCTTISFERVREIAKACKAWQNGDEAKQKPREWRLAVVPGRGYGDQINGSFDWQVYNYHGTLPDNNIRVREVLPGEDDV